MGSVIGVGTFYLVPVGGWDLFGMFAAAYAAGGFTIGAFQWTILRASSAGAGWWILANAVAFFLAVVLWASVFPIGVQTAAWRISWLDARYAPASIDSALNTGLVGIVVGVVTGAVLVWLLSHSRVGSGD